MQISVKKEKFPSPSGCICTIIIYIGYLSSYKVSAVSVSAYISLHVIKSGTIHEPAKFEFQHQSNPYTSSTSLQVFDLIQDTE